MAIARLVGLIGHIREAKRTRVAQMWIVRLDAGYLSRRHERRLRDWIGVPGNVAALHRAARLWNMIDHAVLAERLEALRLANGGRRHGAPFRRLAVSALMLAGISLAVSQSDLWIALQADARTGYGESRILSLADGSRITLDGHSAVDIAYEARTRRVRLLSGRAQFEVAPAPNRPFLVEAQGGVTRALGTTFTVNYDGRDVVVSAIRHNIEVSKSGARALLQPGQSVRYEDRMGQRMPSPPDADAWMHGLAIFRNSPLSEIANALQRYSDRRIIVWGAARDRRFSGVIHTTDPIGGIAAMTRSAGLTLRLLPGMAIITLP